MAVSLCQCLLVGVLVPLEETKKNRSPIPFLVAVALGGFGLLMWLGNWQLNRQEWKDRILESMEKAPTQTPIPMQQVNLDNYGDFAFQRVQINGMWGTGPNYFIIGRTHKKRPGYHLVNIVQLNDGRYIAVNIGWMAHKNVMQKSLFKADLVGRIRQGDKPGWLSPPHIPGIQEWSSMDLEAMGNAIGIELEPFYVDYVREDHGRPPFPIPHMIKVNNKHFGYAVMWFGMGGVWLIMFMLLIYRTKRDAG